MTKHLVVAIRDSAVNGFGRPFFVPTKGAAIRSFVDEVNRVSEDNPMYKHPDDYELFALCEFEDDTGTFAGHEIVSLCRGKDVKNA